MVGSSYMLHREVDRLSKNIIEEITSIKENYERDREFNAKATPTNQANAIKRTKICNRI